MYFKSIEMSGFKSFVDHTKITFGKGITSIVGPNGCGKSNISDGIRWVLGEQRAKLLRGTKMEDFIFSGSANRKQAGMAEVTITIADIAGKLSRPELAEFNEVSVTRRLYRSGESEYMINKTPCRLKDVVDLFLDTGINTRAFSIIEQDQVQRIVTSKPEDRRYIIEEAAGIMKYKTRRHDALNKLEGAKGNLDRISDIISELDRQKNALKRQANKAERYKAFKEEMDQLFVATSADEWRSLKTHHTENAKTITALEEKRAGLEAEIATRRNELVTIQSSLDEQMREHGTLREEEFSLKSNIENSEQRIEHYTTEITEATERVERLTRELDDLTRRHAELEEDLAVRESAFHSLEAEVGERAQLLEQHKGEQAGLNERMARTTSSISEKEMASGQIAGRLAQRGNAIASDQARLEMMESRIRKTELEKEEAQANLTAISHRLENQTANINESEARFASLQQETARLSEEIANLTGKKEELDHIISDLKTAVTEKSTRLESMREVENAREGYQEGIRSLLKMKEEGHELSSRLKGTFVDRIRVDKRYEAGLEAVLGHRLEALLVQGEQDAFEVINQLHQNKLGRATFLAINGSTPPLPQAPTGVGIIGSAATLVQTDSELKPLVDRLLGNVLFVEDLSYAPHEDGFLCVTPRGDILDRSGAISGGSSNGNGAGILERKRVIEELSTALEADRNSLQSAQEEHDKLKTDLTNLGTTKTEKDKELKQEELNLLHEKKDLESITKEHERHATRLDTYTAEIESMTMECDTLKGNLAKLETEIADLKQQRETLANEIETLETGESDLKETIRLLAEEVSALEVALTSRKGELNMASADARRIRETLEENGNRKATMTLEITSLNEKRERRETEIATLKETIHTSLSRKEELTGRITAITERLEGARGGLQGKEEFLRSLETSFEEVRESLGEARIKRNEYEVRYASLMEKLEDHNLSEDDLENFDDTGIDMEECHARMSDLREKMSGYGDVNLSAIDDYNQVMERLTFLETQRDDLLQSINDIKKVIDKLNRTTKELFETTFVKIRENFREIYKRLFNGGEADMVLTDESNLLESGVEIIARPPGKKRQNLTLLSAGEKAMTALSVLFSVFLVMPSPFCLLDEVDAPLDEANIGRFKDILLDFAESTQFLVITHNQKTMAFADRLYGITMQQPGISQVLSVDLVQTDTGFPEEELAEAAV